MHAFQSALETGRPPLQTDRHTITHRARLLFTAEYCTITRQQYMTLYVAATPMRCPYFPRSPPPTSGEAPACATTFGFHFTPLFSIFRFYKTYARRRARARHAVRPIILPRFHASASPSRQLSAATTCRRQLVTSMLFTADKRACLMISVTFRHATISCLNTISIRLPRPQAFYHAAIR